MTAGDDLFASYLREAGGAGVPTPPRLSTTGGLNPAEQDYFDKYLRRGTSTAMPPQRGWGSRLAEAVLAPEDIAFRYGAHAMGLPVSEDATAAGALAEYAFPHEQGEGYGTAMGRSALQFGAGLALNPLTYALPGGAAVARGATAKAALEAGGRLAPEALGALAPEAATAAAALARRGLAAKRISQAAGLGFTGMMGAGVAQRVPQLARDVAAEGWTPRVAGEAVSTGLEAAGAGLGAAHLAHGLRTPYGVPEPRLTAEVPVEGPAQPGAIPRVTQVPGVPRETMPAPGAEEAPPEQPDMIPVPGFERGMHRARGLSEAEQAVADRATQQVLDDPQGTVAAYRAANTKNGTLTINTDNARELFPDYNASQENRSLYSAAVHEPSSWTVRRAWEQALAEPTPEGKQPLVVFTSGGTGVGKSTGLKAWPDAEQAHIVFDTNMNTLESAAEKIDQAKAAGKKVTILYTHRDPVKAWFDGVLHRAMRPDYGRMVPLDSHMETSQGAPEVSRALRERYANDPDVSFQFVDNSGAAKDVKLVDPSAIDGIQYDWSKVREQIEQGTRAGVEAGKYPPRILQGAGIAPAASGPAAPAEPPGVLPATGGVLRGEPTAEPVEGRGQPGPAPAVVPAPGVTPAPQPAAGGGLQEPIAAAKYAVAPRPPTPPSPLGFYSQLARVTSAIPQPMRGSDMARYLSDPKRGVKVEEMKWTGLDDWLKENGSRRVTPQEVQDFVRANQVEVKEVTRGGSEQRWFQLDHKRQLAEMGRGTFSPEERAELEGLNSGTTRGTTKFGQWQLPGGENYREVLLALPERAPQTQDSVAQHQFGKNYADLDALGQASVRDLLKNRGVDYSGLGERAAFTGGHFPEPNVLAHVRLNDRTDADGKRVLFVEEVQSDWSAKGRREGFREKARPEEVARLKSELAGVRRRQEQSEAGRPDYEAAIVDESRIVDRLNRIEGPEASKIPAGPFVGKTGDYTALAMKRILRMAAEEGYDRVAWTTGEQQVARYDLSKQVDRITYRNGDLRAYSRADPSTDLIHETVPPEKLADYIGKSAADKLMAAPEDNQGFKSVEGVDLKVGGEGMNAFYDKILPQVVEKIGKKWGVRVGETQIPYRSGEVVTPEVTQDGSGSWKFTDPRTGQARYFADRTEALAQADKLAQSANQTTPVHSIDISPSMRASVTAEGFPQFRAGERTAGEAAPVQSTKPLTIERAKAAFPGIDFKPRAEGGFIASLEDGGVLGVTQKGEIEIGGPADVAAVEASKQAAPAGPEGAAFAPVGVHRRIGPASLVTVVDAGSALDHEAYHFFRDRALTDKEKASAAKRYGSEEAEAYAYEGWRQERKTSNSWFSKIYAFAKRLIHHFSPTWESTFEEIASGRAGKRIAAETPPEPVEAVPQGVVTAPQFATAPAETPAAPQPPLTDRLKEAALGAGGRTSAKPGAGGEREGPINLDRLNTPDDIKQLHDRLTTAALPEIRRGKGRMTLAEIKAAGEDILGKGQFDERRLEKAQRENSALNSAQMTAARMLNQSAIDGVMEVAKAHNEALKDPHADPTRTEDALNAAVLKWKGIGLATLGRQAEAARALAAHNIFVEGLNPEQRMLHDMMKQNGVAMSDADARELVLAAAKGDRKAVQDAARKALAPSWFDKFYEVYVNGLISGPATHIANNASNTTMQAAGVVKRLLSAGIEQVRAGVQGQTPERFVDDTYADLRGMKRGMTSAFEPDSPYSFSAAMKGGAPGGKLEINRLGAIPGKLGEIVRLPGTALEAEDKVFKSMSFFREAYVRAGRKARGEANNRSMAGADLESYVSKRREEIVDSIDAAYRDSTKAGKSYSGPFKDVFEPAEKAARYDTFQKEAGPILAAIMKLREADPTGIFKIVMPFMRTPANIAKVTLEHTPLKVFDVIRKVRSGELKGGEISDELAKPLFGSLLALPIVYMAKEGMLTGSGPTDPKERELWQSTGAQPNSVVIPIDGKLHYISYGRLEPISTLMTMAVDFHDAANAKTRGTAADKIVGTILNAANDKTFLAGLSDLVLAWHDPKRYLSTLVKDTAGNLVPASSLMRATAHAVDPVVRQRVDVLDAMVANIPGLSTTLPAKPTGTGVPIERQHPVISSLTPFGTTEERPENKVQRLMLDIDFHPSTPEKILTIPGSHGRKVELTRDEYAAFQEADRRTTEKLQGLADRLKTLPPEEQRSYLERAYGDAARRVRERLYSTPSFRERARTALDQARQERQQYAAGAP